MYSLANQTLYWLKRFGTANRDAHWTSEWDKGAMRSSLPGTVGTLPGSIPPTGGNFGKPNWKPHASLFRLTAEVSTFEAFDFGTEKWDLIVLTYEPTKAIAPRVAQALRPGGIVVVEDRHLRHQTSLANRNISETTNCFHYSAGFESSSTRTSGHGPDWSVQETRRAPSQAGCGEAAPKAAGCIWEGRAVAAGASVCWDTALLRCGADGWNFTREKCPR